MNDDNMLNEHLAEFRGQWKQRKTMEDEHLNVLKQHFIELRTVGPFVFREFWPKIAKAFLNDVEEPMEVVQEVEQPGSVSGSELKESGKLTHIIYELADDPITHWTRFIKAYQTNGADGVVECTGLFSNDRV